MKRARNLFSGASIIVFTSTILPVAALSAHGVELKGQVINVTTRKPAAGDEVVLFALADGGMDESARTNTDSTGHFSFVGASIQSSLLIRVEHQGVTYHKTVDPGLKRMVVSVYDVAEKLDGVSAVMDVQRFEATSDRLEVKQLITMRNASVPLRTLMNDRPFEIQLPLGAQVQSGFVQVEDGQPIKQRPLAGDREGQYYFHFPIRPGDTRFAVIYELPYHSEALIEPVIRNPMERFVVMLPNSMRFEPKTVGVFRPMPGITPDNVQGTAPMALGQTPSFRISGTGMLEELAGRRQEVRGNKTEPATRPGGGLGPPIEAPDPLHEYRWLILAGLAALTMAGAVRVTRRAKLATITNYLSATPNVTNQPLRRQSAVRMSRHRRRHLRV